MSLSRCDLLQDALDEVGPILYLVGNFVLHYYPFLRLISYHPRHIVQPLRQITVTVSIVAYASTTSARKVYGCQSWLSPLVVVTSFTGVVALFFTTLLWFGSWVLFRSNSSGCVKMQRKGSGRNSVQKHDGASVHRGGFALREDPRLPVKTRAGHLVPQSDMSTVGPFLNPMFSYDEKDMTISWESIARFLCNLRFLDGKVHGISPGMLTFLVWCFVSTKKPAGLLVNGAKYTERTVRQNGKRHGRAER